MKKFLLSTLVIIIFTVYALHMGSTKSVGPVASTPGGINIPTTPPAIVGRRGFEEDGARSITPPVATGTTPPVTTTGNSITYKNGTYTGSVADAFYGNIQVQVVISGGKITDVQFLQYPSDRQTSIDINSQAMPYLKQEAIQAQSAQVSGVTGATATSQAFIQSLSSALSQAG